MALAQSQPQVIVQESKDLREIIARLNERLDEPFVTVNTVTGDKGIKQAQDEYQRLMNNKSPKSKRKWVFRAIKSLPLPTFTER